MNEKFLELARAELERIAPEFQAVLKTVNVEETEPKEFASDEWIEGRRLIEAGDSGSTMARKIYEAYKGLLDGLREIIDQAAGGQKATPHTVTLKTCPWEPPPGSYARQTGTLLDVGDLHVHVGVDGAYRAVHFVATLLAKAERDLLQRRNAE